MSITRMAQRTSAFDDIRVYLHPTFSDHALSPRDLLRTEGTLVLDTTGAQLLPGLLFSVACNDFRFRAMFGRDGTLHLVRNGISLQARHPRADCLIISWQPSALM